MDCLTMPTEGEQIRVMGDDAEGVGAAKVLRLAGVLIPGLTQMHGGERIRSVAP